MLLSTMNGLILLRDQQVVVRFSLQNGPTLWAKVEKKEFACVSVSIYCLERRKFRVELSIL